MLWLWACTVPDPDYITVTIGEHSLPVEVSDTPRQRQVGLQRRTALDGGMLFVFPAPQPVSMWSLHTPLPLSVAFVDAEGTLFQISDMQPDSRDKVRSESDALYVLEVHRGWFRTNGVQVGVTVDGLPPAADR